MTTRVSTPLHDACKDINTTPLSTFKELIEEQGFNIDALDQSSSSPLHLAFKHFEYDADIDIIRYLLDRASVNQQDENGYTVLHYACKNHHLFPLDVFKTLLDELNADPALQTGDEHYRCTALHLLFGYLNDDYDITTIKYLCSHPRVNINQQDERGETALHTLSSRDTPPYVLPLFKLLIEECGADINVQTNRKDTPLLTVLFTPCSREVKLYMLSQPGINVNAQNVNGKTVLHQACLTINNTSIQVYQRLVELGADVNIQDNDKMTPLHYAFRRFNHRDSDIKVISYLLSQPSIDLSLKDKNGNTCIEYTFPVSSLNRPPFKLIKCVIDNALLRYSSKPKEEYMIMTCYYNPFSSDCLQYWCENTIIDFDYKDDKGVSLLHHVRLSGFITKRSLRDNVASPLIDCLITRYIHHLLRS